jgi:hypothetical protein
LYGIERVKLPSVFDVVAILLPLIVTKAFGMGEPSSLITLPVIGRDCPNNSTVQNNTIKVNNNLLICFNLRIMFPAICKVNIPGHLYW